ncbi:hypothetical protein Mapa_009007 [Marchantia paleacea]|nr:hypothetical protein Mapa_009007 [Marchantia paleacea]
MDLLRQGQSNDSVSRLRLFSMICQFSRLQLCRLYNAILGSDLSRTGGFLIQARAYMTLSIWSREEALNPCQRRELKVNTYWQCSPEA